MISSENGEMNSLWAELIVEELVRLGVEHFVLSPGSRCTPLTVAVERHRRATYTMHYDERGAAYFALGRARATGIPAPLICTSGTAAANYFPAVVEAAMDLVPMVLLTADRPPELRHTGANQTIDQVAMYGKYVRYNNDLPVPDRTRSPEILLKTIDQAMHKCLIEPEGPVHINCPYPESLEPPDLPLLSDDSINSDDYLAPLRNWLSSDKPMSEIKAPKTHVYAEQLDLVTSLINECRSGVLTVGRLRKPADQEAVRQLIKSLNWPVLADIRSGLRLACDDERIIAYFDQLLLSDEIVQTNPAMMLYIGDLPTSKRWLQWVEQTDFKHYIHVADHPLARDPVYKVTSRIQNDVADFCDSLRKGLRPCPGNPITHRFQVANRKVEAVIGEEIDRSDHLSEPLVARLVSKLIPEGSALYLASSMPIRDMDMYAAPDGNPVRVAANRGASGIDGVIASATGFLTGANQPVTLVIGDLSFMHDLNSLTLSRNLNRPLIIVLINNRGGGIFSMLPIRKHEELFEPCFGTPHDYSFDRIARTFSLAYSRPGTPDEFTAAYRAAIERSGSTIIEVRTDREENRVTHLKLQQRIKDALDET